MIDVKRKFLILAGEVVYFDRILDFAVQRRMEKLDISELSRLQPGALTVELENLPDYKLIGGPWYNKIGAYLINYAIIFNDTEVRAKKVDDNTAYMSIKSSNVDILFHSHKYPPLSNLEPLLTLIYDERNKD